ncbi:MAG TPA: FixH family protein [Thermoanaerobaculia bacterium]|nr:FixH family protein [Thermoanaerobaculia bacterium]
MNAKKNWQRTKKTALWAVLLIAMTAAAHAMLFGRGIKRPAESEFGLGPRASAQRVYIATLQPDDKLRVRKLQTVRVQITDANGQTIDGATVAIDGGMPQHGHGLPTRPRVTKNLGNGIYEIEGLRFNMGGWWELKLAIETAQGADTVTFNLAL